MKKLIIVLILALSYTSYSQSIKELEYDISWHKDSERYGEKISRARLLQKLDPFNINAIEYICRYYNDRHIDSVSIYFDKLISKYPRSPYPYILRANLLYFEVKDEIEDKRSGIYYIKQGEYLKKAIKLDPKNFTANYNIAELYYKDFIKPFKKESNFNSKIKLPELTQIVPNKKSQLKKSHFAYSRDSALFYLKRIETISPELRDIVYFPIKQLENYKNSSPNVKLDSLMGISDNCYFPIWYFANLSANWSNDISIDYLFEIESSKQTADRLKLQLENLAEPCLYNTHILDNKEVYRFTWLRSFHSPIAIRIEKDNDKIELVWKEGKGAGGYEPKGIANNGERIISISEWNRFIDLFNKIGFDNLPNETYILMTDGASWTMEKKTSKYFKAHRTNDPDAAFKKSCLFLLDLSGIKIKKEDIY